MMECKAALRLKLHRGSSSGSAGAKLHASQLYEVVQRQHWVSQKGHHCTLLIQWHVEGKQKPYLWASQACEGILACHSVLQAPKS